MMNRMTGWIAIPLGDVTGIGPEVTLKAIAAEASADEARYLLIGDASVVERVNKQLGSKLEIEPFEDAPGGGRFFFHDPLDEALPKDLEPGDPAAARASIAWLTDGARRCLSLEVDALVTAPVNKQSIIRTGLPFVGQTEFLSEMAGTRRTAMMLLGQDDRGRWLRVALATTHLPLKQVASQLNGEMIERAIELADESCRRLALPTRRIAVCGLNPHAGEGGKIGDEEINLIAPVVEAARKRGIDVAGPFAADTLFHHAYHGNYDVVVAMYHDQGLVPLKMVAFNSGVNWTLGLPFVRTSPDHGTAYDIAGKGVADPSSMRAAIRLAKQLSFQPRP
jgi:4-hydroxythreonine-4-phosphate dehydrogenase